MTCCHLTGKPKLADYGYNKYSQFGEDGIIEKIFEIIGTTSKVCIEFGAADGFDCSNSAVLWTTKGWQGILIETNEHRFKQLINNIQGHNCIAIHTHIDIENNSLESTLQRYNIKEPIDLLSIDVDGDDYYILKSLHTLKPRVIICEYNPTMPTHLDIYPAYGNHIGCSPAALVRLAQEKGYKLIAITHCNCFFVYESDFDKFNDFETSLEKIKMNQCVKNIITSYDGNYLIVGEQEGTPWGINKPYTENMYGNFRVLPMVISN